MIGGIGQMFRLLAFADSPIGAVLLVLLAAVSIWLGWRYSRPREGRSLFSDRDSP